MIALVVAGTGPTAGASAVAAAIAVAAGEKGTPALWVRLEEEPRRLRSTLLCAPEAAELEERLTGAGLTASARGHICHLALPDRAEEIDRVAGAAKGVGAAVLEVPPHLWWAALHHRALAPAMGVICAGPETPRSLPALACAELAALGVRAAVWTEPPARLEARRSCAGLSGGAGVRRAATLWARAAGASHQVGGGASADGPA